MNDRTRTIRRFYKKHQEVCAIEWPMILARWSGKIVNEYQAYVKVKKLKGNLKDGTLEFEEGE